MSVVFDRPYEFVPRHRGNLWPWLIRNSRLVDYYLAKHDGVVEIETRNAQHLIQSIKNGHGIIVAPNHSRYSDPLAMTSPVRAVKHNFYAIASWHLYNKSWFDSFAITKCGAFSLNREGTDRKSLDTAIEVLSNAERPLVMFGEGMTYRTNDWCRPMMDGMSFIGRAAARRRAKQDSGSKVVIHPMAIKYFCVGDCREWVQQNLTELEDHFCFRQTLRSDDYVARILRIGDTMLTISEIEYMGSVGSGDSLTRREVLAERMLQRAESNLEITPSVEDVGERARTIRIQVATQFFDAKTADETRQRLRDDGMCADMAQDLISYPNSYLESDVTDARIVETIQRLQERVYGKANRKIPLKCVMDISEAIEIPAKRAPRGETDPILTQLHERLSSMLKQLAGDSRPWPIE